MLRSPRGERAGATLSVSAPLLVPPLGLRTHVPGSHGTPHSTLGIWRDAREQVPAGTGLSKYHPAALSDSAPPDAKDSGGRAVRARICVSRCLA
jgi:hypothetical protein